MNRLVYLSLLLFWLSPCAGLSTSPGRDDLPRQHYELIVVGGGSGGFGAALAAARLGVDVLLVEKADCLGGTSVRAGVNCWEPGAGGTGIPFDVYLQLRKIPGSVGVYSFGRHLAWFNPSREPYRYPGGETVIDPSRNYADTLRRHGSQGMSKDESFCRQNWHGVPFEPDAMAQTMKRLLDETGHCRVLFNTVFRTARAEAGRVQFIELENGDRYTADFYIDSTDGLLCQTVGCQVMRGQESREQFAEPSAPAKATPQINGVSLIYRVTARQTPGIDPLPAEISELCWWRKGFPVAHINQYPNGDLNVNMLPTMEGAEFMRMGEAAAYDECRRRVAAHWHDLQSRYAEFRSYRLSWIAPALGIRETRRIVGEYVLTESDLRAGLGKQQHPDIICIADHSMDTHGSHQHGSGEMREPYGVPYRCLIPRGFRNLLIASRAVSASSLAASSCRLSRTIMQLGQAAGTAVALAARRGLDLPAVPADLLRQALRQQHVQLEHPMPDELKNHLRRDGFTPAFSTYLGGSGHEETRGITVDPQGNIYLTGRTDSPDFPTTPGAFDRTYSGTQGDIFVAKLTPSGQLTWSTLIGGAGAGPSKGFSIRVDAEGFVYVAGQASTGLPVTTGVFQPQFRGHHPGNISAPACGFLAKLKPDGSGLVWLSYCGSFYEHRDMTIDAQGDIYVTSGWDPEARQQPLPGQWFAGAFQSRPQGGKDFMIIKVQKDGSRVLWATYLGGSRDEPGIGSVRVDDQGFVYVLTSSQSSDIPILPAIFARQLQGKDDYYLAKLTPDGSRLVFATLLGGSEAEFLGTHSLDLDAQGCAYVSCFTASADFPTTAGAFQRTLRGKSDAFVSRFSPQGQLLASTFVGGSGGELTEGIAVGPAGQVVLSGGTDSADFPITAGACQSVKSAGRDGYLAVLSYDLSTVIYATYWGGGGEDMSRDTVADGAGNLYFAGMTRSADFPVHKATQPLFRGVTDLAIARFSRMLPQP